MTPGDLEIPESVRKMAEEGVRKSRNAYDHLATAIQQAENLVKTSPAPFASAVKDLQALALQFANKNATASFDFAAELAGAKSIKDWLEIHKTYANKQTVAYIEQARELGEAMEKIGTR